LFKIFIGIAICLSGMFLMMTVIGLPFGIPILFIGGCVALYGVFEVTGRALGALGLKRCPYCAETIRRRARVCKHCGKDV